MKTSRWPLLRWDDGAVILRLTESSVNEQLLLKRSQLGFLGTSVARGMEDGTLAVFAYLESDGKMDFVFAMDLASSEPHLVAIWPSGDIYSAYWRTPRTPTQKSLDRISAFVYEVLGNPLWPRSHSPELWKILEFPVFIDGPSGDAARGSARAAHLREFLLPTFLAQRIKLADPATHQAGDDAILLEIQAEVFDLVTWILNDNLGYAVGSYRPTKDRKRLTAKDGRLFGQSWSLPGHWKDNRRLVLSLKGEPTWAVQQPHGRDRFEVYMTTDPTKGPAEVLRESHTVLDGDDLDWWLDRLTARSGEPVEMVDLNLEAYELLDTPVPLLWADAAFIEWYLGRTA